LVEGLGISISQKTSIMETKGEKCKQDNLSLTHLLLGLVKGAYILEYIFQIFKFCLNFSIIFLLFLLCKGLCKKFQNVCNFQKVLKYIYKSF
jgi:hypothetical protein